MKQELAGVVRLPLESIEPSPFEVRTFSHPEEDERLKASIREQGLIHPIVVRPHPDPERYGQYELICGCRRYRAFVSLAEEDPERFGMIPAQVRRLTDEEALLTLLEENELREDFTPYERALFFHKVYTSGQFDSIRRMARSFRMGVTTLHRYLRIFDLPPSMIEAFRNGRLTFSQMEVLLDAPQKLRNELYRAFLDHPMRKEEARRYARKLETEQEDLGDLLLKKLPSLPDLKILPSSSGRFELRLLFSSESELKKTLKEVLHALSKDRE